MFKIFETQKFFKNSEVFGSNPNTHRTHALKVYSRVRIVDSCTGLMKILVVLQWGTKLPSFSPKSDYLSQTNFSEQWGLNPKPQDRLTHYLTNCAATKKLYIFRSSSLRSTKWYSIHIRYKWSKILSKKLVYSCPFNPSHITGFRNKK